MITFNWNLVCREWSIFPFFSFFLLLATDIGICCWPVAWKHVDCSWVCTSLFLPFMFAKRSVFETHSTISACQSLFPSQYHLGLLHNVYNWQQMNKLAVSVRTCKWECHLCPTQLKNTPMNHLNYSCTVTCRWYSFYPDSQF